MLRPDTAAAQGVRNFPADALRGEIVITAPPEIVLNRQPARLAPGARIRGMDNMLVLSGAAAGQRLRVHYTRDLQGQLLKVWVLTAAEEARKPWPETLQEAAAWRFDADAQRWSKP
ncbi:MAG: hypothetical protein LH480_06695 [Rubrivivax sp.]|nr:hypothetical protein [Rubrivivax sp.]